MSTIHFHQTTRATPELFGNSADDYLEVHDQGGTEADVTEGSGGVWEREHYDWSDPNHVVVKTTDSITWGDHSGHTYDFTRNPNGTTDGSVCKSRLETAFVNSIKAVEARNGA